MHQLNKLNTQESTEEEQYLVYTTWYRYGQCLSKCHDNKLWGNETPDLLTSPISPDKCTSADEMSLLGSSLSNQNWSHYAWGWVSVVFVLGEY